MVPCGDAALIHFFFLKLDIHLQINGYINESTAYFELTNYIYELANSTWVSFSSRISPQQQQRCVTSESKFLSSLQLVIHETRNENLFSVSVLILREDIRKEAARNFIPE